MRRQLAVKGAGPRRSLHCRPLTLAMGDFGASPGARRALQIIFALVCQAPVPEMVGGGRAGRDVLVESQKPERPTHAGGARARGAAYSSHDRLASIRPFAPSRVRSPKAVARCTRLGR